MQPLCGVRSDRRCVSFQYSWNENEMFLFKSSVAYAVREFYRQTQDLTRDFTSVSCRNNTTEEEIPVFTSCFLYLFRQLRKCRHLWWNTQDLLLRSCDQTWNSSWVHPEGRLGGSHPVRNSLHSGWTNQLTAGDLNLCSDHPVRFCCFLQTWIQNAQEIKLSFKSLDRRFCWVTHYPHSGPCGVTGVYSTSPHVFLRTCRLDVFPQVHCEGVLLGFGVRCMRHSVPIQAVPEFDSHCCSQSNPFSTMDVRPIISSLL